jgi:hypothetical protein
MAPEVKEGRTRWAQAESTTTWTCKGTRHYASIANARSTVGRRRRHAGGRVWPATAEKSGFGITVVSFPFANVNIMCFLGRYHPAPLHQPANLLISHHADHLLILCILTVLQNRLFNFCDCHFGLLSSPNHTFHIPHHNERNKNPRRSPAHDPLLGQAHHTSQYAALLSILFLIAVTNNHPQRSTTPRTHTRPLPPMSSPLLSKTTAKRRSSTAL